MKSKKEGTVKGTKRKAVDENKARDDELLDDVLTALDATRAVLTIVEGKNDRRALEQFGFTDIITLDRPLYQVVERITRDEVAILTDLDRHGQELYRYFYRECTKRGIRVNNRVRQALSFTALRQIEGLPRFIAHAARSAR